MCVCFSVLGHKLLFVGQRVLFFLVVFIDKYLSFGVHLFYVFFSYSDSLLDELTSDVFVPV